MSEPTEGSAMTMESSGLEIFNHSIQNQLYSLVQLIDDLRNSVDQDLHEISDNTSDIVKSVSSHLVDRLSASFSTNCSCDIDLEMVRCLVLGLSYRVMTAAYWSIWLY